MRTEGWTGKGRSGDVPQWKLEARKARNISANRGYSMGGLPRKQQPASVSLPKLKCLEDLGREERQPGPEPR